MSENNDAEPCDSHQPVSVSTSQKVHLDLAKPWLRPTLYFLGVGIPAAVVADWLTDFNFVTNSDDPMFMTVMFTMALVLWLAPGALEAAVEAYERIWHRKVIQRIDEQQLKATLGFKGLERAMGDTVEGRYSNFIRRFSRRAKSRWQWCWAGAFFLAAYVVTWVEVTRDVGDGSPIWFGAYAQLHGRVALVVVLAQLVVWALVGVIAWKVLIIALETARLCRSFLFEVVVGHPDRSGGLAVMGYMCFRLALIVTVPSILCAVWVVVLENESPEILFRPRYATFEPYFRTGLALLIVLTFTVAFRPLRGVHKAMKRGRREIQVWLDEIAVRINEKARSLLSNASEINADEAEQRMNEVTIDQTLIAQMGHFPTWPFDRATLVKLSASQVVPVFSVLGIGGPIADLVENLISALGG